MSAASEGDVMGQFASQRDVTTFANRTMMRTRLANSIEHARQSNRRMALLYIDIDEFKEINDAWGHDLGDEVLKTIEQRLPDYIREIDSISQVGGDEMVVIGNEIEDLNAVSELARSVFEGLKQPVTVGDHRFPIALSIGVSLYPDDADNADTLLSHADSALYAVKHDGGGSWRFYTPQITETAIDRVTTKANILSALNNGYFSVAYQPIVRASDHVTIGHEALARWQQDNPESITPNKFIPLAESSGLIADLNEFVFREACAWLGSLPHETSQPYISLNVSPIQLESDHLIEIVESCIDQSGIQPDQILLEMTESVMINANPVPLERLYYLRRQGMRIAIDDFGTGYASLQYLNNLPIDILKIDKAFVRDLDSIATQTALVQTFVNLAASFNLKVIAEGIETQAEARAAYELGCDYLQGFYLGRPTIMDEGKRYPALKKI